jgi:hypothetical protein
MQSGNSQRFFRQIYSGDIGAKSGHALGKDAAATAYIENLAVFDVDFSNDPIKSKRVDFVQRSEFAVWVPPAMCKLAEFVNFTRVGICHDREQNQ